MAMENYLDNFCPSAKAIKTDDRYAEGAEVPSQLIMLQLDMYRK